MSVNPAASGLPGTSQQPNIDPEGTIIDWLRREAALEKEFPYLKRKRSDGARSTDSLSTSSTSSTTGSDDEDDKLQGIDLENDCTGIAGQVRSESSGTLNSDPPTTPSPLAPTPSPLRQSVPEIPPDPQWVTSTLREFRLYQESRTAFAKYPQFQERVRNIVNQERKSSVDPKEYSKFQLAWDTYKGMNEDTILSEWLHSFIKNSRTVSIDGTAEEKNTHAEVSYIKSGLRRTANQEFRRTCVPLRGDGSPLDKKLFDAMAKEVGAMNPKPHRAFGISMNNSPLPIGFITSPEIATWLQVVPSIHHPFFFIEAKSYEGNLLDAQNEACRGGATLVSTARRLLATLGIPDIVGADTRTFVFSATLSPGMKEIWVHWAEVPSQGALPLYHMNRLMSKAIADEENFGQLRKTLHNILDWGCGPRLTDLQPLYPAIIDCAERQRMEAEQAAVAARVAAQKAREEKASNKRPRLASGA